MAELDPDRMPRHVAIIMDGNGRWAKKRLLNRIKVTKKGRMPCGPSCKPPAKLNIAALTLYAFSTENWQRPQPEISGLMLLLRRFLEAERQTLIDNDIRLNTIGQIDRLPQAVRDKLTSVMADTAANTKMVLNLALSYGARAEIVDMVQQMARPPATGNPRPGLGDVRDRCRAPVHPGNAGRGLADPHQR
jgi:undecaprenyl diphosphate synthase